jgi:hypothetical protein
MSDEDRPRLFGRKRRANVDGDVKREKSYRVYVTPEEDAQLRARAAVQGVTVPRLLFESALNAQIRTDTEWKQAAAGLFKVQSLLGGVANNINQLAKFANAEGVFPEEARAVTAEYRKLVPFIEDAVKRVAGL